LEGNWSEATIAGIKNSNFGAKMFQASHQKLTGLMDADKTGLLKIIRQCIHKVTRFIQGRGILVTKSSWGSGYRELVITEIVKLCTTVRRTRVLVVLLVNLSFLLFPAANGKSHWRSQCCLGALRLEDSV
jgi:hypothetical protein